jgi:hypothetical protein
MPAQAGIQNHLNLLDSRLRGNDGISLFNFVNELSYRRLAATRGFPYAECRDNKRNERARMEAFRHSLKDLLQIKLDIDAVDELPWRDFGNGLLMARLAREGRKEMVLYRIRADAKPDAFVKHEHPGGEIYLVLKGRIADETGEYQEGDVVFLEAKSVHTPRAIGDTLVLVLWPEGVRIIDEKAEMAEDRR